MKTKAEVQQLENKVTDHPLEVKELKELKVKKRSLSSKNTNENGQRQKQVERFTLRDNKAPINYSVLLIFRVQNELFSPVATKAGVLIAVKQSHKTCFYLFILTLKREQKDENYFSFT